MGQRCVMWRIARCASAGAYQGRQGGGYGSRDGTEVCDVADCEVCARWVAHTREGVLADVDWLIARLVRVALVLEAEDALDLGPISLWPSCSDLKRSKTAPRGLQASFFRLQRPPRAITQLSCNPKQFYIDFDAPLRRPSHLKGLKRPPRGLQDPFDNHEGTILE